MKKLIIAVCIIAVIAAIAYFLVQYKPQPKPSAEESYVLEDSLNTILREELEKTSVDQSAFNTEVENNIACSLSLFYYG
ncbi:MAG: hypothetical protein ACP5O8_01845 [Candidatus Aenigmatarchaeota archaeon]